MKSDIFVKLRKKTLIGIVLSLIGVLLFGFVIINISLSGIDNKSNNYIGVVKSESKYAFSNKSTNAFYELFVENISNNYSVLSIYINSDRQVDGADVVINIPNNSNIENVIYGHAFTKYHKSINSNKLSIYGWYDEIMQTFSGRELFAKIFIEHNYSSDKVSIACKFDSYNDSNINYRGDDYINCNKNIIKIEKSPTLTTFNSPENYFLFEEEVDSESLKTSNDYFDMYYTAGCDNVSPDRPTSLTATPGPDYGEITLRWDKKKYANRYAITYGTKWMDFEYGIPDVGDVNKFIVKGLRAGVKYYFVVTAINECSSSGYSDGVASYPYAVVPKVNNVQHNVVKPPASPSPQNGSYDWKYQKNTPNKGTDLSDNKFEPKDKNLSQLMKQNEDKTNIVSFNGDNNSKTSDQDLQKFSYISLLFQYLPWIGGIFLVVFTILLIKFNQSKKKEYEELETALSHKPKSLQVETDLYQNNVKFPNKNSS